MNNRWLFLILIVSLLACALMPVTAALFSGDSGACHSMEEQTASDEQVRADDDRLLEATIMPGHLCDETPAPLSAGLVVLLIIGWSVLVFPRIAAVRQAVPLHFLWRRGYRRDRPALRSHLIIGRILV